MTQIEPSAKQLEEYVWISKSTDIDVFTTHSHPIMHRLGQEWGVKVTIAGTDRMHHSDEAYIKAIYDAIDRKVAGILIHGWGLAEEVDAINTAIESGIPVITVDCDVPLSKRLAYVGTDWFRMGGAMADQLAGLVGNAGKVLYMGNNSLSNHQAGFHGFQHRMEFYPNIELIGPEDDSLFSGSEVHTMALIEKHPDITGIAGFGTYSGLDIANALEKMGLAGKIKVVCIDATAKHIECIHNGSIQVAFFQRRELFTYRAFHLLYAYNHGSEATAYQLGAVNISGNILTGFTIVTPWNVDSFKDDFNLDAAIERKKLARRPSLLSTVVESSGQMTLAVDSEHLVVYANPATVQISGLTESQIIGKSLNQIFYFSEENLASLEQGAIQGTGVKFETVARKADADSFPVELTVSPLQNETISNGLVIIATDISEHWKTKKVIRESEERLRQAVGTGNVGIFDHDHTLDTLYWSLEQRQIFGWGPDETVTFEAFLTHVHPDDYDRVLKEVSHAHDTTGDGKFDMEYRIVDRQDKIHWVRNQSHTIFSGEGSERHAVRTIGAIRDITEEKNTTDLLREQQQFLQLVLDNIPSRVFWKDTQSKFLGCNQLFAQDIGLNSTAEVIGLDDYALEWSKYAEQYREDDLKVMESGEARLNYEEPLALPDGKQAWLQTSKIPLHDFSGKLIGILGTYEDITERKRMEEDLLLTQFSVDHASIGIVIAGSDGHILSVNQHYCNLLDYNADELCKMHIYDLDPNYRLENWQKHRSIMRQKGSATVETVHYHKDGSPLQLEIVATHVSFQGKEFLVSFIRDISERNQMLEALRMNSFAVERATDAVYWIDANTKFVDVNEAACKMLGYTREELIGKSIADIEERQTLDEIKATLKQVSEEGSVIFETQHKTKTGQVIPVEVVTNHISYKDKEYDCAFVRDITNRKKVEEELKERQDLLNESQRFAHAGSWAVDLDTSELTWSDETFRLYGYLPHEIRPTMVHVMDRIHPDDRSMVDIHIQNSITMNVFDSLTYRIILPDGTTRWLTNTGAVRSDDLGKPIRISGVIQDVTERKLAEDALQRSETRFRALVENSPDYIVFLDLDFRIQYINRVADGSPTDRLVGVNALSFALPQDVEMSKNTLNHVKNTGEHGHYEVQIQSMNGSMVWLDNRVIPIYDDGQLINLMLVTSDITERKMSVAALKVSEERLSQAVRIGNIGIIDNRFGDTPYISSVERSFYGWSPDDIVTREMLLQQIHPDDAARIQEVGKRSIDPTGDGLISDVEFRIFDIHGVQHWLSIRTETIFEGEANERRAARIIGAVMDITEYKQMESSLLSSQKRLELALQVAKAGAWEWNEDEDKTIWSEENYRQIGLIPNSVEPLYDIWLNSIHPDDRQMADDLVKQHVDQRSDLNIEFRVIWPDGSIHWLNNIAKTRFDKTGQRIGTYGIQIDVTERKESEATLQESQQLFSKIFYSSPIGISISRLSDGVIIDVNKAGLDILGYDREEIVGQPNLQLDGGDRSAEREKIARQFHEHGRISGFEVPLYTKLGEVRTVLTSLESIDMNGMAYLLSSSLDITDRKKVEEALRQSEKQAREFQEKLKALQEITIELAASDTIESLCSRAIVLGTTKLGYDRLGMGVFKDAQKVRIMNYGINEHGVLTIIRDGKLSSDDMIIKSVLANPSKSYVSENAILYDDTHTPIGKGWNVVTGLWSNDDSIGWLATDNYLKQESLIPYQVELLNLFGLMLGHLIVRKRRETEIQILNQELEIRVAERTQELEEANEEIKNFAYIVSHDLRAPLVNLKGFSAELRSSLKIIHDGCGEALPFITASKREAISLALEEDVPEALRYIESSVSNMDTFTKAILMLSRLGRLQLDIVTVDVKDIVKKKLETLGYQINQQSIKISIGDLPKIDADAISMDQIIGNILGNAIAYLDPQRSGEIEITSSSNANETTFCIRDNGRGISIADMEKVFIPFRRAGRQDVPGEGMGLAYVQTLVRRHGGRIWCESVPDEGSTFYFTISHSLAKDISHLA